MLCPANMLGVISAICRAPMGETAASTLAIARLASRTVSPHRAQHAVPLQNHPRHFTRHFGGIMPFINGRYHVNPTMGAALEAAREAEAALLASQDQTHRNSDDASDSTDAAAPDASAAKAPIHRVEIEASELLPSSSGRATSGFIARIHRSQPQSANGSSSPATKPETHVFSNHGDLINFLHDELSKR
jgi:hypothetical protein